MTAARVGSGPLSGSVSENVRTVYVAWTNTDLTEGRGARIPLGIYECEATATRMGRKGSVQGCDCEVTKEEAIRHNGRWYAPACIYGPSREDIAEQTRTDARRAALAKAKAAGLTPEELSALSA